MTRSVIMKKEEKKKDINPVWRGIGCLLIIAIFIVAFFVANWFISAVTDPETPLALPPQLSVLPSAFRIMRRQFGDAIPWFGRMGQYIPELLLAVVVAVIMFGIITAVWSLFRGNINDPRDARKFEVEGRRKRNVRRCR